MHNLGICVIGEIILPDAKSCKNVDCSFLKSIDDIQVKITDRLLKHKKSCSALSLPQFELIE